ncbi:MAG: serine/threonine-protein kinase [Bacteroidetes bacterium]|nr:serine/threonine-protein kinase [Bacteroidota bacterium]
MLPVGIHLNGYEISSVIGQGGFGIVYKGRHQELGIDVAIKEYFPSQICIRQNGLVKPSKLEFQESYNEGLDRFVKEARQLENFHNCPNIVTCRDLFMANGTAYIVMEYVLGVPLSVLLEQREKRGKPLNESELLQVILPVLRGLQVVHESGVCHRDIKPSNIIIRRDDSVPVLIDFGAAKHEISQHTKSFAPYSDGYAAIEQVGEGDIGPWTDIYGIGALMWRIVAGGNPPFDPPIPMNSQKRAFDLMHGREDPLPSSTVIGAERFSHQILQAIDDSLIINVKNRIQSCKELMERLDSVTGNSFPQSHSSKPTSAITNQETIVDTSEQNDFKRSSNHTSRKSRKPLVWGLTCGIILLLLTIFALFRMNEGESIENIMADAQSGDADAQFKLGLAYDNGLFGMPEDLTEAVKWYDRAAHQGHAEAQLSLGFIYDLGQGVVEDDEEAVRWYREAAIQGLAMAQYSLGTMYYMGNGVEEDNLEAFRWFSLAAEQDLAEAQYNIGDMYYYGHGVEEDYSEAMEWYGLAAQQDHAAAQFSIGVMHYYGYGVAEDHSEALKWFRLAADQGLPTAQYSVGDMYYYGQGVQEDNLEALKWYRLAADQELFPAQYRLGDMYYYGFGVQEDKLEAMKWYNLAADQGFADAQYQIGEMYFYGHGVQEDNGEAMKWYQLAAEQDHADAQFSIGIMYSYGYGVPENYRQALRWFRLAANQCHVDAMKFLAEYYSNSENYVLAYAWLHSGLVFMPEDEDFERLNSTVRPQLTGYALRQAERYSAQIIAECPQ